MKLKSLKKLFTITLPTLIVILLLLEVIFRTIIPASTHPFFEIVKQDEFVIGKYNHINGVEGIKTYGPFGVAKSKWKINNQGWNSHVDYQFLANDSSKLKVAVIGDSYVEAFNVLPNESVASLIRSELGDEAYVYSFGIGGSPLSQYLNFSRYVKKYYDPDIYIITITNNDIDESLINYGDTRNMLLTIDQNKVIEVPPFYREITNSKFRSVVKKSALIRYLYYNLQITRFTRFIRLNSNKPVETVTLEIPEINIVDSSEASKTKDSVSDKEQIEPINDDRLEASGTSKVKDSIKQKIDSLPENKGLQPKNNMPKNVINPSTIFSSEETIQFITGYLLNEFSENCKGKQVIFLNDGQRKEIYKGKTEANQFQKAFKILQANAVDSNFTYIDLHDVFQKDYLQNGQKFNYAIDYHWNKYGHEVVADTLIGTIEKL